MKNLQDMASRPQDPAGEEGGFALDDPTIRKEIDHIRALKRSGLRMNTDIAIQIGAALSRTKLQLKRGLWTRVLRDELHFGASTAKRFIRLFEFSRTNGPLVAQFKHLGPNKLTLLAALTPEIRQKMLAPTNHRLAGSRCKTLEEMNPTEFVSLIRGLDPHRKQHSPRVRHLVRVAIKSAIRLVTTLNQLKDRSLDDPELVSEFKEAILRLKNLLMT